MFSFSAEDINSLRGYLHSTLKSPDIEVEIRFSTCCKPDTFKNQVVAHTGSSRAKPEGYFFKPVIEKSTFYRVLEAFKSYSLPTEYNESTDYFYDNYVRKTVVLDSLFRPTSETWVTKTKSRYIDIWEANIRICQSTEMPCGELFHSANFNTKREKKRTSFFDECIRYDFTIIYTETNEGRKGPTYEIEIEHISPPTPLADPTGYVHTASGHIISCTMHMLKLIQDSAAVMSLSERHNIAMEYSLLVQGSHNVKPRFIGAQPETLHRYHVLKVIAPGAYALSEKYDGTRFLMFISDNSEVYLIGRNNQVSSSGLKNSNDRGSIMEAELVNRTLYVFDVIFYRGEDLRGNPEMNLRRRLALRDSILPSMNAPGDHYPARPKEYFFDNFNVAFERWNALQEGHQPKDNIARDGFIFTPINEPYPTKAKWTSLLKWKPIELESIDFLVKEKQNSADSVTLELHVGDLGGQMVLFEPNPKVTISKYDLRTLLNNSERSFSIDNTIVEFVWDSQKNSFVPWRIRRDKNSPNFKTVALDVWKSIQDPVPLSELLTSPFQGMRKFHNAIKSYLVQTAAKTVYKEIEARNCDSGGGGIIGDEEVIDYSDYRPERPVMHVLDLACGRGGDLLKWKNVLSALPVSVDYVGIDISEELLSEARQRSSEMLRNRRLDSSIGDISCKFYKMDLSEQSYINQYEHSFDIVSCQFAMHYFFKSEETFQRFIKTVQRNLKRGGLFICTLFDGMNVLDLINKGDNLQNKDGNGFEIIPKFNNRLPLADIKRKEFSIPISAVITGDDNVILKEPTDEYLVFPDLLVLRMKKMGFKLVESRLFSDSTDVAASAVDPRNRIQWKNLSPTERLYSDLHRYYVFSKTRHVPDYEIERQETDLRFSMPAPWVRVPAALVSEIEKELSMTTSFEETLYLRRCCSSMKYDHCQKPMTCLYTLMETITGHVVEEHLVPEKLNPQELCDTFTVCLLVMSKGPQRGLYRPEITLKDLKMVIIVEDSPNWCLVSRVSPDDGALLYFVPPEEPVTDSVSDSGKSSESNGSGKETEIVESMEENTTTPVTESVVVEPMFLGRPLGRGGNSWTIRELQEFAKAQGLKLPSSLKKKMEIYSYIVENLVAKEVFNGTVV